MIARRVVFALALAACAACAPPEGAETPTEEYVLELGAGATVGDHLGGCSSLPVHALEVQIAEEVGCMDPAALESFEEGGGIVFSGPHVLPFLAAPAKAALLAAVAARGGTITINSGYRTVASQFMLRRWDLEGRCGIPIAADPGESNHESGRALDVREYDAWLGALRAQGWSHDVPGDPVHFDHLASPDGRGADVLAFQRLWNYNHPEAPLDEDGDYGPLTENALSRAPADGFAIGSSCGAGGFGAMPGAIARDVVVESGGTAEVFVEIMNTGSATWTPGQTFLGTAGPRDRASELADASWVSTSRAVTVAAETPPGATGRFVFLVHGPEGITADTNYAETFGLVEEGVTWFGPEVTLDVLVVPEGEGGGSDGHGHGPSLETSSSGGCTAAPGHARAGGLGAIALCALAILLTRRPRSGT